MFPVGYDKLLALILQILAVNGNAGTADEYEITGSVTLELCFDAVGPDLVG